MQLLGIDTGGTFTDFFYISSEKISVHKTLSTPDAPERAILQGIEDMGLAVSALHIIHGTTVATNATLEGKGARTLYIGNSGFADILRIARQTRSELYNLRPAKKDIFLETNFLECGGRLDAQGNLLNPVSAEDLEHLQTWIADNQPEAVAINLLFSYLDDSQEKLIEAAITDHIPVSRSSFVLPVEGEYERGIATWLNARLAPLMKNYLGRLQKQVHPAPVAIMQSSGGAIDAAVAQEKSVNLLLSGPAGGLSAARFIGSETGINNLITFDMGGTSTDVALLQKELVLTTEGRIGQLPVAVPMIDMHTIGAGGGSIAYLDEGGILQVGPQSAGADPGPACYGKGGSLPTVTDANVVLGKLLPDQFLGGRMQLDSQAARDAVQSLAAKLSLSENETAQGILHVANEHMVRALRTISVAKGFNPADFHLCCFGGAGGLHVCELAEQLRIANVLVPVYGGILSALGMTVAPQERMLTRTHRGLLDDLSNDQIEYWFDELSSEGIQELLDEGVDRGIIRLQSFLDLRYQGQSFTLTIPWRNRADCIKEFHQQHQQRYGHRLPVAVELLNLRCRTYAPGHQVALQAVTEAHANPIRYTPLTDLTTQHKQVPVYLRKQLGSQQVIAGPALICEEISTTYIASGWTCRVDQWGNLLLKHLTAE